MIDLKIQPRTWAAIIVALDDVVARAQHPGYKKTMQDARRDIFEAATRLDSFGTDGLPALLRRQGE